MSATTEYLQQQARVCGNDSRCATLSIFHVNERNVSLGITIRLIDVFLKVIG